MYGEYRGGEAAMSLGCFFSDRPPVLISVAGQRIGPQGKMVKGYGYLSVIERLC